MKVSGQKPFDWKPAFLAALRSVPVVGRACQAAGVGRSAAYEARQVSPDFAKAWDDAMEDGVDGAEAEAFRRAVQGYEEPVIYQGQITPRMAPVFDAEGRPVIDEVTKTQKWAAVLDERGQPVPLTIRKHSDALLSKVLSARRAAYRTERTELTGADGGPVAVDETTRLARLAQILAAAKARKEAAAEDPNADLL